MDCGIPFCHQGCPLGNLIPDWNDLVYRDRWRRPSTACTQTNNFPEFTGRLCPAPCEGSCVLGINKDPVTIKSIELAIVDRAFDEGWVVAAAADDRAPGRRSRSSARARRAGRSRAAQSRRPQRHGVRECRSHRRPAALRHPRVQDGEAGARSPARAARGRRRGLPHRRATSASTSPRTICAASSTPILLAGGADASARPAGARAASCTGVHFAMDYLTQQNRRCEGDDVAEASSITPQGKHVVIIGGGDTGADCLGTAHRQGAASVTSSSCCRAARRARRRQPMAAVAERLPHVLGARGRRRARLRGGDHRVLGR